MNTLTDGPITPGQVRLRDAIAAVVASNDPTGTQITFQNGLTGTISLQSALPTFMPGPGQGGKDVVVVGPGSGNLTVTRDAAAATNFDIFGISVNTSVHMSGITVTGNASGRGFFVAGSLELSNSVVSNNRTTGNGGGIGVAGSGFLDIFNVVVSGNGADGDGGGIYVGSSTLTGPFQNPRILVEGNSQIFNNNAQGRGGGIFVNSPGLGKDDDVQIAASTISQNTSTLAGGGLYFATMSSLANSMQVSIGGSTIIGNRSRQGSGGALFTGVSTYIVGTNIIGNFGAALAGYAVAVDASVVATPLTINNSSINNNQHRPVGGGGADSNSSAIDTGTGRISFQYTDVLGNSGHGVSGMVTSLGGNRVDNSATTSTGWQPFPIDDVS